ncbi:MAG: tRNA (adenosine(37)-N6)-threonylcarbamoyltransferase complex dimerization subunit type 1 TsaB [Spiroplasma sp.]
MYKLYLDSSGAILTIIIAKDNQVLESYSESAFQKQTELALKTIDEILKKLNISLKTIDEIIITNGPGSYTGVRVAITFAKTLSVLNPRIKIFVISSLLLQVGLKKAISIISGYNNKSYLAVYDQGQEIIRTQLVTEDAKKGIIGDLQGYIIINDYQGVDIVANFLILEKKTKLINKLEDLQPLYIGDKFEN